MTCMVEGNTNRVPKVPIFSLPELRAGRCAAKLKHCLTEHGVFYLQHSGLSETDHEPVRGATLDFFRNASVEERLKVSNRVPGMRRGYTQLESESTARVTGSGEFSDYSECYSMGNHDNLFPSNHFQAVWTSYFASINLVALDIADLVLSVMDVEEAERKAVLADCDPVLRFRNYPAVDETRCAEKEPLRMASHYDLSIVTLIHQTPCANGFVSLQYEHGSEQVPLPAIPDTLLVMCGSVATLVTDGGIKAPKHQVVAPSAREQVGSARTSAVFFLRPSPGFEFSTVAAKKCGFDICVRGSEVATFRDWIGGNYNDLSKQTNK